MAAEWMQPLGCEKYGSDNHIYIAKSAANKVKVICKRIVRAATCRPFRIREGDPSQTTLTPIDRFCWAIHSVVERITK